MSQGEAGDGGTRDGAEDSAHYASRLGVVWVQGKVSRLDVDAQRRHDTLPPNVTGAHRRRDDFFAAMPHLEVKMMHTLQESAQEDENKDQLR